MNYFFKLSGFSLSALLLAGATLVAAQQHPKLSIHNVSKEAEENITNHLALQDENCEISERRARTLVGAADEKIEEALRAIGYYQASWRKELTFLDKCWQLRLDVELGDPIIITQVQIEILGQAQQDPIFIQLLKNTPLKTGNKLDHGEYEAFKHTLQKLALQHGYPESRYLKQQLGVNIEQLSADIQLSFNSGPRYAFGPIFYEQNYFDESFLARYQPFSTGQPFDANLVGQFQQALINSRYFKDVSVAQLPPDRDKLEIPLQALLTPVAKHATSLGLGIATDTGPRASLSYMNNRANRAGHSYGADIELSQIKSAVNADYQIPLAQPNQEQIKLKTGWEDVNTDNADNETWSLGISHTTVTSHNWIQTLDLSYQVESFSVAEEHETTQLLIPGISWHRSHANNLAYPTSGWRIHASMRGSAEQLGSDISFLQLSTSTKYILSLGKGRLLGRLEADATMVNQFAQLPASLRFFAGGDNSVRGYDYRELGPTNSDNQVIGGKHLLAGSLEFDYPLFDKYGIALFYDTGNAFDNSQFTLKHSVGFGGRWRSPIGPIRLDFAFPIGDEQSFRLHLSMGPDL